MNNIFDDLPFIPIRSEQRYISYPIVEPTIFVDVDNCVVPSPSSFQYETKPLNLMKLNMDLKTMFYEGKNTKDLVERTFVEGVRKELWKLEERGIKVFVAPDCFSCDSFTNQKERCNEHYLTFNYSVLEEDLFAHAFVNGVTSEALEEACKIANRMINRKIEAIFNKYKNG